MSMVARRGEKTRERRGAGGGRAGAGRWAVDEDDGVERELGEARRVTGLRYEADAVMTQRGSEWLHTARSAADAGAHRFRRW